MRTRVLALAAVLGTTAGVTALPAPPSTTRYRVENKLEQVVDLSAMGQEDQRTNIAVTSFLAITLSDTAGGRTIHLVIDSMVSDSTFPNPELLAGAKGTSAHGMLQPSGEVTGLEVVEGDSSSLARAKNMLDGFFPRVRPGAKPGDTWTDTTNVTTPIPSGSLTKVAYTNYSVVGTEMMAGMKALKIQTASSFSQSGSQGPASIDGTGTGTATYYVGPNGQLLGSEMSESSTLLVTGAGTPEPIPITIKNTRMVSVIK